jgi:hypothetical protein
VVAVVVEEEEEEEIQPRGEKICANPPYIQRKCAIWIVLFHEC